MSNREPASTNVRARLTAKRELLVEAVRAWAASGDGLLSASVSAEADLREAWRDYREAEKKTSGGGR